jgi:hypothetical protein
MALMTLLMTIDAQNSKMNCTDCGWWQAVAGDGPLGKPSKRSKSTENIDETGFISLGAHAAFF